MTKQREVKEEESVTMSEIALNVLIKFIGTFDGSRDKLTSFLNNCRNAINLASASQAEVLLKYILSLEGKAEKACAVKEFTKWSQLNLCKNVILTCVNRLMFIQYPEIRPVKLKLLQNLQQLYLKVVNIK